MNWRPTVFLVTMAACVFGFSFWGDTPYRGNLVRCIALTVVVSSATYIGIVLGRARRRYLDREAARESARQVQAEMATDQACYEQNGGEWKPGDPPPTTHY